MSSSRGSSRESSESSAVPAAANASAAATAGSSTIDDPVPAEEGARNITKTLGNFRSDPVSFLTRLTAESSAFYQGIGWRGYDKYIGAKLFEQQTYDAIEKQVVSSQRVQEVIHNLAGRKGSEAELQRLARSHMSSLSARIDSKSRLRFVAYIMNNAFNRVYHQGIHISDVEFEMVKHAALDAEAKGISVIFLPQHRSHLDYCVLSYIFYRLGISLPHIAAGENLNIPIVGDLLRRCGAFFIRRTFSDDLLYTTIFKEYVETLLARGYNLEAFIEGTRSRTGKLLNPKVGFLKILMESVVHGRVKDAYVVPIAIGYDKVIETASYVEELLGSQKKPESLGQVLESTRLLQLRLGRVDVRFAKPFLLSDFIANETRRRDVLSGKFDIHNNPEQEKIVLKALAFRVCADINNISIIMPTALVGTVLLTLRGRGIGRNELIRKVKWLRHEILMKGGRVADFQGMTTSVIVDRATAVLKGLVGVRQDMLEPIYYVNKRFELSYYRNQTIHLFISEAVLAVALYSSIKLDRARMKIKKAELLDNVMFISQLLKTEFIFPPGTVVSNMERSLLSLKAKNVLDYDGELIGLTQEEVAMGRENFDFYCFLIWPFIETYWMAAVSVFSIPPKGLIVERIFMERTLYLAKTYYYEGDLSYFESISKETLKNAFDRLEEIGILERRKLENLSALAAATEYQTGNKLRDFVEQVGKFRREGKNRRDNKNTSERVLRLARMVGNQGQAKL